ncbi:hypothetical protein [Streptomyces sp. NRRL S-87]|uniref:hypothetical protein n=1 Tax=Streptomyces sp. NRRL S-87 TaxID=1463920 RepID=UPI000A54E2D8|nr:hypothetical protein [Streptomyces sp. NRRL S-87]
MDLGSVIIAVAGVAGTLGGSFLTQRAAEKAKRRELALVREHEEVSENLLLRRTCYVELNRDARQFATALNRHLHVMRERGVEEADRIALDEAKSAHRDRYSQAQMIAPDEVLACAGAVNFALTSLYGQVKRMERGEPEPGETPEGVERARVEAWARIRVMRSAMRADLGVSTDPGAPGETGVRTEPVLPGVPGGASRRRAG